MSEKRKVGRPKVDNKMDRLFTVRLDNEMFEQLHSETMKKIWDYTNIDSLSSFIRSLLKQALRNAELR